MNYYLLTKREKSTGIISHHQFDCFTELLRHLQAMNEFTPNYELIAVVLLP